ncbi:TSCPD domain-containing protein [Neokomagataea tanensis]|nr:MULTISPECIES: vitamin B12-dependent ribonucleotide reductase [Neokomagataea]
MRTLQVTTDPDDSSTRAVTLPAAWDDAAAEALARLAPGEGPVRLATEAARWVDTLDACLPLPGTPKDAAPLGHALSCLLLFRQIAPNAALWRREAEATPGFVVRLSSFVDDGAFSAEHFAVSLAVICDALRRLQGEQSAERSGALPLFDAPDTTPKDPAGLILLTDLDACLAAIGLDYDSDDGRAAAQALTALTTAIARAGTSLAAPTIPDSPLGGLRNFAARALPPAAAYGDGACLAPIQTGFSTPGPVDGLLDVEACGLAPIFSPTREDGRLRRATLQRLEHRGLQPQSALALALSGTNPLPPTSPEAHERMHHALCALVDFMPELPEPEYARLRAKLERGARRPLPNRQRGFTQRAAIGGHGLFMRTSEFDDGSLGEVSFVPAREGAMTRGLMECLGQAVSIGLQHGAPLGAFVERFAYARFGAAGTVEGDPSMGYASSMVDYAFRTLSDAYLDHPLPDAPQQAVEKEDPAPMLPLNMDGDQQDISVQGISKNNGDGGAKGRRRRLRLVS